MSPFAIRSPFVRSRSRVREEEEETREEEEERPEGLEDGTRVLDMLGELKGEVERLRNKMEALGDVPRLLDAIDTKLESLTSGPPSPVDVSQQESRGVSKVSISKRIRDATVATGRYAIARVVSVLVKAALLFMFLLGVIYLVSRRWGFSVKRCCLISLQATLWLITGGTGVGKLLKVLQ